jgi:hypothetical protein
MWVLVGFVLAAAIGLVAVLAVDRPGLFCSAKCRSWPGADIEQSRLSNCKSTFRAPSRAPV